MDSELHDKLNREAMGWTPQINSLIKKEGSAQFPVQTEYFCGDISSAMVRVRFSKHIVEIRTYECKDTNRCPVPPMKPSRRPAEVDDTHMILSRNPFKPAEWDCVMWATNKRTDLTETELDEALEKLRKKHDQYEKEKRRMDQKSLISEVIKKLKNGHWTVAKNM